MRKITSVGFRILVFAFAASAAHADVNHIRAGSTIATYPTIQGCANVAGAGDTCRVNPGTYNERVTLSRSGTAGNFINIVGAYENNKPHVRGFEVDNSRYVRIIGFEISHTNRNERRAITLTGNSCSHIHILNNYIHNVHWDGIGVTGGTLASNIVIRGNRMVDPGVVLGNPSPEEDGTQGIASNNLRPDGTTGVACDHWLVEYNDIKGATDFANVAGQFHLLRNNFMHDAYPEGEAHSDIFQPGSDGANNGTRYHVYESNLAGDSPGPNGHFGIWQDTVGAGDQNILIRGNVGYRFGNGGIGALSTDYFMNYSNTFYKVTTVYGGVVGTGRGSLHAFIANTIVYDADTYDNIYVEGGSGTEIIKNNLGYLGRFEPSYVSTDDPLFSNVSTLDFTLQSGSPARSRGATVTQVTSLSGSGPTFNVGNAFLFTDGYGIAEGDLISVGGRSLVRITAISGNSITVSPTTSWNNGDGVNWRTQATTPDIGAYEYRAGGYGITNSLNLNNGDTVSAGSVSLAVTVNDSSLVRFVEFWVDGLPMAIDYDAPYQYNWDASGVASGSSHLITVIARPLHASQTLSYSDSATITVGQAVPTPATITTQPQNQTVQEGQTATFTVVVAGHPTPSCQWQRNNGDGWNNILGATELSYTTSPTVLNDNEAQFRCVVTNNPGTGSVTITSNHATLTVSANPPVINTHPQSQSRVVGSPVTFSVNASGSQPLSYQWQRNGADISGANANSYTIPSVANGDAGSYRCMVTNPGGTATSNSATLTVTSAHVAPNVTTDPQSQTINEGQSVTFTVEAEGTTPMSYQWMINGANIINETSASYTRTNVTFSDNGTRYSCRVSNTNPQNDMLSDVSAAAILTVNRTTTAGPPDSTTGFLAFKNVFNPARGERLRVLYTSGDSDFSLILYDRKGSEVRVLERVSSGESTWDGKNSNGQMVAAGTYTLILKSSGGKQTKKVVVVK